MKHLDFIRDTVFTGRTIRWFVVLGWLISPLAARTASAQDKDQGGVLDLFRVLLDDTNRAGRIQNGRPRQNLAMPVDVAVNLVDADFANTYSPSIAKVLTSELHFVKKVCQPNERQFDEIHRAGRLAAARTAKRYAELQRMRQSPRQWPKPHVEIIKALRSQVAETMPDDVAQRYREEVEAREQFRTEASVGIMMVQIDDQLLLSPDQYREIRQTIATKWDSRWSSGPRLFMYPQYAVMPNANVLGPLLSKRQRDVWSGQTNTTNVNFGWQMELGLQDWLGAGIELPAFEKPKREPPQSDADSVDDSPDEATDESAFQPAADWLDQSRPS